MCHTGGAAAVLKKYVEQVWRIPIDHFDPAAARCEALARANRPTPLEEVLVEGRSYSRRSLKDRLYAARLKQPICELCGQGEIWRGKRMSLILDHVNGIRDDNRLENLRIVCPNCAATLDTHCGRNKRVTPLKAACARCGETFRPRYAKQRHCSSECGIRHDNRPQTGVAQPHRRKVERPDVDRLLAEIEAEGFLATGRRYGVSDNAIRKWVRQYEWELSAWAAAGCPEPAGDPV
ncbi:MAG: HNH endonuclease [Actinomycetota bacterium]|nr:HNH endonuclease [Actinomycetota bacterium]